jgi:hypothetical protein
VSVAEPDRTFHHGVEHRLKVECGASDRLKDVADRRLPLERLLRLVEQADVLDRDDGLVGERPEQVDLLRCEGTSVETAQQQRADRLALPQQWCYHDRVVRKIARLSGPERELAIGTLEIIDLDDRAVDNGPAGNRASIDGPLIAG